MTESLRCILLFADVMSYEGLGLRQSERLSRTRRFHTLGAKLTLLTSSNATGSVIQLPQILGLPFAGSGMQTEYSIFGLTQFCINRHDDYEKSVQVRKMRNIYQKARAVVAWLGHLTTETGKATAVISKWNENAYHAINSDDHGPDCLHRLMNVC